MDRAGKSAGCPYLCRVKGGAIDGMRRDLGHWASSPHADTGQKPKGLEDFKLESMLCRYRGSE